MHAALHALVTAAGVMTGSKVARVAGVSRRFIYSHSELLAQIHARATESASRFAGNLDRSARVSAASLQAELEATKAANHRLRRQTAVLEGRLSRAMGAEVAAELADRGALLLTEEGRAEMETLRARIAELEDLVARRDEELTAARTLNRDLMAEINRTGRPLL